MKTGFKKLLLTFIPKKFLKKRKIKAGKFRDLYLNQEHTKYYDALKKSAFSKNPSYLFKSFHSEFINTNYFSEKWWDDYIKVASNFDESYEGLQNDLVKQISDVELSKVQIRDFIHFYSLSLRTGLFNIGFSLRNHAREAAYQRLVNGKSQTLADLKYGIAAYTEFYGYDNINKYYTSINRLDSNFEFQIKCLKKIHSGISDNCTDENDLSYSNLIKGKNIAVVGPAKVLNEDADEIDSYDIVVRCNFKEDGVGIDETFNGVRSDVSYLNGAISDFILNEKELNWPSQIKWVVCKVPEHAKGISRKLQPLYKRNNKFLYSRSLTLYNEALFHGTLNAIPNIVLDLLQFQPKNLKVFHADLNLTVDRTEGYKSVEWSKEVKKKSRFLIAASRTHEPLTQYNLLHGLWRMGKITGDNPFNRVMDMGEKNFMNELQKKYGDIGRVN